MGFFNKLFGGKDEKKSEPVKKQAKKPVDTANLPVQKTELEYEVSLELAEIYQIENRDLYNARREMRDEAMQDLNFSGDPDEIMGNASMEFFYRAELEYVVVDEELMLQEIGDENVAGDLNEMFYVCMAEHNEITIKDIESDRAAYGKKALEILNCSIRDWGLEGKKLSFKTIEPTEEYREAYEEYKAAWGW